ncbi:MAG TPA: biotin--[acetyl-CoA-carboxylase] ligase [Fimbriimonas sp.]|nr:biotin--[acetyl-CoA-carboxylase] ligase [Fimbriimonas sp.]
MKAPAGPWLTLEEVDTTQRIAAELVKEGRDSGVVMARHQVAGKGRLGRTWHSDPGDSLTVSLIFHEYADHPRPYLIGMACALAAAGAVHTQLRWPNDLVIGGKKVGGILTELFRNPSGALVPVVGIGINLNQQSFPTDLDVIATSLALQHQRQYDAVDVAHQVVRRLALLPEPSAWSDLSSAWDLFDRTPGKMYKIPNGELAVALGIGSDAQLLCSVDGESRTVLAAEAIFGHEG